MRLYQKRKYFTIERMIITAHHKTRNKQSSLGFTLTELLVVIAIIGMLSSIVLISVSAARNKGKNARAVADISQYLTGLALVRENEARYPVTSGWVCLGSEATCKWDNTSHGANSSVNTSLSKVMSSLPVSTYSEDGYQGYEYSGTSSGYQIRWFMYGKNNNCDPGQKQGNTEKITLCLYKR